MTFCKQITRSVQLVFMGGADAEEMQKLQTVKPQTWSKLDLKRVFGNKCSKQLG